MKPNLIFAQCSKATGKNYDGILESCASTATFLFHPPFLCCQIVL